VRLQQWITVTTGALLGAALFLGIGAWIEAAGGT
jgi:hypothetical protein